MAGPVLRTSPQRRPDARVVALVLSLALAIAAPVLLGSGLALSMATQIAWLAIVLLANNLLLGQCGLLSFGHALQVGAGALAGVAAMRWGAAGGAMPLPLVPLVGGLAALARDPDDAAAMRSLDAARADYDQLFRHSAALVQDATDFAVLDTRRRVRRYVTRSLTKELAAQQDAQARHEESGSAATAALLRRAAAKARRVLSERRG